MNDMTNNVMLPWEEWKIEKLLGRGSFGEVYQVIRDEIGTEMRAAVKIIRIPMDESKMERLEDSGISAQSYLDGLVTDIANEIVLMQTLKGAPNIVGIDDYKIVKSQERIQWTITVLPVNRAKCIARRCRTGIEKKIYGYSVSRSGIRWKRTGRYSEKGMQYRSKEAL